MEKAPFFSKSITLGNILTVVTLGLGGIGVYNQIYAEVTVNKTKILVLEQTEIKREMLATETKQELRQDLRDVRNDVKDLNNKIDKLIYELNRSKR